jgi:hypothetical protein
MLELGFDRLGLATRVGMRIWRQLWLWRLELLSSDACEDGRNLLGFSTTSFAGSDLGGWRYPRRLLRAAWCGIGVVCHNTISYFQECETVKQVGPRVEQREPAHVASVNKANEMHGAHGEASVPLRG